MNTTPDDHAWLTASDVARQLGLSTAMVRLLALNGRLPHEVTASGVRLFARRDVAKLAEERRSARP